MSIGVGSCIIVGICISIGVSIGSCIGVGICISVGSCIGIGIGSCSAFPAFHGVTKRRIPLCYQSVTSLQTKRQRPPTLNAG